MKDGKLGCGGLIVIILLVFAFLNDFASELGGAFQFFFWIGIIIIIGPDDVVEQMRSEIKRLIEHYS